MNAFEGANKLIGPGSEFDHLKQLIEQKLAEIGPLDIDTLVFGIRKLSDEERSQIISLLEKMGIHIKSRM